MSNANWERDDIQFPRLIAEINAAGGFTSELIGDLRESMGLTVHELEELVERAEVRWEEIKAGRV